MNEITLIGQLSIGPTYHCTVHGQDLLRFELRTPTPGQNRVEAEAAHHCIAWGPAALDLHQHLNPGDRLLVRGELRYRTRRDRRGGGVRIPEIHVKGYSYLGVG